MLAEALSIKSDHKVEIGVPQRGERKLVIDHALANAREALGRKLADSASQQRLLAGLGTAFGLPQPPRRIEVYDNSHIQGTNAVGAMIVAGPEGFRKNQYRKFNIRSEDLTPGDDFGMMREVLGRRFKRLLSEAPRAANTDCRRRCRNRMRRRHAETGSPWPDLVLIDGGEGQLTAARESSGRARGRERGRWWRSPRARIATPAARPSIMPGRAPFRLPPRDPVLYFVQRLRDEAHRFAIGSHRPRRRRDIREAGLQEIAGIGPTRKRALLRHFGTLKAIERASVGDLSKSTASAPRRRAGSMISSMKRGSNACLRGVAAAPNGLC